MAGTIDLPVIGQVPKVAVYVGGAVVATVVGVAWWQRSRQVGVTYAPDLATGSDTGSDKYANPDPHYSGDAGGSTIPKTDQEWAQRVLEKMTWLEPGYVSTVIGKYLAGQGLTLVEAELVRSAWALLGKPPGSQAIILKTDSGSPGGNPDPNPDEEPNNQPKTFTVYAGQGVVDAITALQNSGVDITYDRIVSLNPGFEANIQWGPQSRPGYGWDEEMRRQDKFIHPATYRLR